MQTNTIQFKAMQDKTAQCSTKCSMVGSDTRRYNAGLGQGLPCKQVWGRACPDLGQGLPQVWAGSGAGSALTWGRVCPRSGQGLGQGLP